MQLVLHLHTQEKNMLYELANTSIDTIQGTKKQFVKTFISNDRLATVFNNFIDAQTDYTKKAINAGLTVVSELQQIATDTTVAKDMCENLNKIVTLKSKKA